jgi:hypothetical protein
MLPSHITPRLRRQFEQLLETWPFGLAHDKTPEDVTSVYEAFRVSDQSFRENPITDIDDWRARMRWLEPLVGIGDYLQRQKRLDRALRRLDRNEATDVAAVLACLVRAQAEALDQAETGTTLDRARVVVKHLQSARRAALDCADFMNRASLAMRVVDETLRVRCTELLSALDMEIERLRRDFGRRSPNLRRPSKGRPSKPWLKLLVDELKQLGVPKSVRDDLIEATGLNYLRKCI